MNKSFPKHLPGGFAVIQKEFCKADAFANSLLSQQ